MLVMLKVVFRELYLRALVSQLLVCRLYSRTVPLQAALYAQLIVRQLFYPLLRLARVVLVMLVFAAVKQQVVIKLLKLLPFVEKLRGAYRYLQLLPLVLKLLCQPRLLRLLFKYGKTLLVHSYDIPLTEYILLRRRELLFRVRFFVQKQRYPRCLLKYLAALGPTAVDYLRDPALPDDRVAVAPQARAHKQLLYIFKPRLLPVYKVLALPRAVQLARNDHLVGVHRQRPVLVIHRKRDLGEAHRLSLHRSVEDNVLHLFAAQGFRALLSHDPAQRVAYVAFPVSVASHNGGGFGVEIQHRFVRKGLEPMYFKRFKKHLYLRFGNDLKICSRPFPDLYFIAGLFQRRDIPAPLPHQPAYVPFIRKHGIFALRQLLQTRRDVL